MIGYEMSLGKRMIDKIKNIDLKNGKKSEKVKYNA